MLRIYYSGWGVIMKSLVVKRSIVAAGHKTSVSLEDAFWEGLKEIARGRNITLSELVDAIDSERRHGNLSSAIRLFVLDFYRNKLADVQVGRDRPGDNLAIRAEAVMPSGYLPPQRQES
jgi:predicted DNA-binding ribbon-helix-helix protein